jgi:Type VI secretion system/phage-baseplate injector OB domain
MTFPSVSRISGVYTGVVVNVADPLQQARMQVLISALPQFATTPTDWAVPAIPNGVPVPTLPALGDTVWIIFSAGVSSNPMWALPTQDV